VQSLLWIIGDWQHEDFREAMAWLDGNARYEHFANPKAAVTADQCGHVPQAVVFAQSRPGQFARGEVEQLHAAAPLARLIVLTGPWCEGEGRSGRPWPGVTRVPWRSWRSRLALELGSASFVSASGQRLPRTATEAERMERSVAGVEPRRFDGQADVYTESQLVFEGLAGGLGQLGLRAAWRNVNEEPAGAPADVALLDGWENVPAVCPARGVLLLHFPRPEDVARAAQLGIAAILPQPLFLAELAEMLGVLGAGRAAGRGVA
jgi:hypothetical protein